ncbi:MAG TPA: MEDS domain-containing protein [Acidimicrobiales bacterium]|jgi:DNA-binding CsgD family transcriptional regulator|nr:MEDS domain-containing protein [Acidimicrobiales bacterium]
MVEEARLLDLGFTPERLPEGTHACFLFGDEVERRSVIYPFIRAGLRDVEDVYYYADALATELLERALDEQTSATLSREELSRLSVASAMDVYYPTGEFVPQATLETLSQLFELSRTDEARGCRTVGEMAWALRGVPGSDLLVEYESSINSLVDTIPLNVLCQYDTEQFDGETIFEILCVHPLMVIRGQIMRNPYYLPTEEVVNGALRGEHVVQKVPQDNVLGRLLLVQLILGVLPDERRIAEFTRGALRQVPGVHDVHMCMTGCVIPPGEEWESTRLRCVEAQTDPNSLDVAAIEAETGTSALLLRTTARLYGLVLIDVADAALFALYQDFLVNIANAIAMALDAKRGQVELRAWPERVANLERRLWRIAREFEGADMFSAVNNVPDPYSLPGVDELSPRQWEVLTRLLHGERVPRIAEDLFLSQSTIRNHLADIFKKLGVHSQEELLDLFRGARGE